MSPTGKKKMYCYIVKGKKYFWIETNLKNIEIGLKGRFFCIGTKEYFATKNIFWDQKRKYFGIETKLKKDQKEKIFWDQKRIFWFETKLRRHQNWVEY